MLKQSELMGFYATPHSDPYWANVVILHHADNLVDVQGNTWTTALDASVSGPAAKYGAGGFLFPGYPNTGEQVNLNTGVAACTGDFTVEFWCNIVSFYINTTPSKHGIFGSTRKNGDGTYAYVFVGYNRPYLSTGPITWCPGDGVTSIDTATMPTTGWHFFAITRQGSTVRLFLDGSVIDTQTVATVRPVFDNQNAVGNMGFGNIVIGGTWGTMYIDELRITKNIARYTTNFVIPPGPFPQF